MPRSWWLSYTLPSPLQPLSAVSYVYLRYLGTYFINCFLSGSSRPRINQHVFSSLQWQRTRDYEISWLHPTFWRSDTVSFRLRFHPPCNPCLGWFRINIETQCRKARTSIEREERESWSWKEEWCGRRSRSSLELRWSATCSWCHEDISRK